MEPRPPREIVGQHIDGGGEQEQRDADPEQRRMMNAAPVAPAAGRPRLVVSMGAFVHPELVFWPAKTRTGAEVAHIAGPLARGAQPWSAGSFE